MSVYVGIIQNLLVKGLIRLSDIFTVSTRETN